MIPIGSLLRALRLAGAVTIIVIAILVSAMRLLMPHVDRYHADVEAWLTRTLGQPVRIGQLSADWYRFGPRLVLGDVRLGADGATRLDRAEIEINLPLSLFRRSLRVDSFAVSGLRLFVIRSTAGAISIADHVVSEEEAAGLAGGNELAAWMLAQGRFVIRDGEIVWIDHLRNREFTFSGVRLDVRKQGDRHRFAGVAGLPSDPGGQLSFAAELDGSIDAADWRLRGYVSGSGLSLAEWLPSASPGGLTFTDGLAITRVWAEWGPPGLLSATGEVAGSSIRLTGPEAEAPDATPPAFDIDSLSARFAWRRTDTGWRLDADQVTMARLGEPASIHRFAALSETNGDDRSFLVHVDQFGVSDMAQFLSVSGLATGPAAEMIAATRPRGSLHDLEVRVGGGRYSVAAQIEDLETQHWRGIPGTEAVNGSLAFDQDSGSFELHQNTPTSIGFANLFRERLPLARAEGRITWNRTDAGWTVSVPDLELRNEDLALQLWGHLDLPGDASPVIALFGRFEAPSVRHLSRYLPAGIMPSGAVKWLDRAIVDGAVENGDLILHGALSDFPFDGHQGLFRVEFDVRNGTLDYADGWPQISAIDAGLVFEGREMIIHGDRGTMLSSTLSSTDVRIDDLTAKPPLLKIAGIANGGTADLLRLLNETPLAARFGPYARNARASGNSRLNLKLALPLDGGAPEIDGTVDFNDSDLVVGGAVDIEHIKGPLHFTAAGLDARRIRAAILGLPATVQIRSSHSAKGTVTTLRARGSAAGDALARMLHLTAGNYLTGEAPWQARLVVPDAEHIAAGGVQLMVESSLSGLAASLPYPLGKAAEDVVPLEIDATFPITADRPIRVSVGDRLSAIAALGDGARVERGEIRLGRGRALLPEHAGVRVAGTADRLDVDAWKRVIETGAAETGALTGVTGIDVSLGQLDAFGRSYHQMRLSATRDEGMWTADVKSREMAGKIVVPPEEDAEWRADLQYLNIEKTAENAAESTLDPRALPALSATSEQFRYGDTDFGRLVLKASRRPDGMSLDQLVLSSGRMQVEAKGAWVVADEHQVSSFDISFSSPDFGKALSALGYAGSIAEGKAGGSIKARWIGGPTAFSLERMDGAMDLDVSDGRLLDVEPGAGRIFGLISLQAFPRRLALDFSDFYGKGFGFDRITGHFTIKDGVANTTDLTMTGPAARITARGDINLAARQYDQIVVVTPNVTSGLPVAGAVAGGVAAGAVTGGLGLGAAIFLMERALRGDIDRMTKITYHVLGPWNDPVIVRLQDKEER